MKLPQRKARRKLWAQRHSHVATWHPMKNLTSREQEELENKTRYTLV